MKYQGVLLDFNGTLFFDSKYHDQAWKQVSRELRGYEVSDDEINEHIHGKNNEQIIDYIMNGDISREVNKEFSVYKEVLYRRICMSQKEPPTLAKGVEAFLDSLVKYQIPFTIASASILENIKFYVNEFHLDRWLDPSLIVYDDGTHVGKVTMFQEGAKRIGVDVRECIVFEDSNAGIRFAHEAQVKDIIAIDSIRKPERYQQFPYIKEIWEDFSGYTIDLLK